ncbi:MAG: carboxypeptidase regulatory-like domain-containing protein [Thermoleophilaceae bacterium]|nr:carboxypeptidase regulatory-like domain-containing protein [Thermoleophilaceae bacterium]
MTAGGRAARLGAAAALVALVAAAPAGGRPPSAGAARAPAVEQMVVLASGAAKVRTVRAAAARARVGRRRCAVPAATPLAALLRSRVARVGLRDYGSCGRSARSAGGLYVRQIGPDRARGRAGWVYKVGNRQGTAGAADPAGPFGSGRLRAGARVLWFFCHLDRRGGCERTLAVRLAAQGGGALVVTVRSYDDEGRGAPAAGATVHVGATTAMTGADGAARLTLAPGRYTVWAEARGQIRSFPERAVVR